VAIRKRHLGILLGAVVLCEGSILSQQQRTNAANQPGLPVGVWESVETDGSIVGIDLSKEHSEDAPTGQDTLQVGVFHKQHERIACGEENFFVIGLKDPNHDTVDSYGRGRLEIQYRDHVSGSVVQLDLNLDPITDVWTGHFHRDSFVKQFRTERFDAQVVLHRASRQPDPAQGGCLVGSNSLTNTRLAADPK
jgi:hypothetical protein